MYKYFLTILCLLFLPIIVFGATIIDVPYTSQAPEGDWHEPWQNACEESVITMVDAFYNRYPLSTDKSRDQILEVFRIKNHYIGSSLDESVETMTALINNFFKWEVYEVVNPTLSQLKHELDVGRPVIVPVSGRQLENPNFLRTGPVYHVLLLVGYDEETQEFITHEPGTTHGEDYRYSYATIMSAMHDYLPENKTLEGRRVVLFTQKDIQRSAALDGDKDGLRKDDELRYGTILYFYDSDGDGVTDGQEVLNGSSPTINQTSVPTMRMVKDPDVREIWFIENGQRRYVPTIPIMFELSKMYSGVVNVSNSLILALPRGLDMK